MAETRMTNLREAPLAERDPELHGIITGIFSAYARLGHPTVPADKAVYQCGGTVGRGRCPMAAVEMVGEVPVCADHKRKILAATRGLRASSPPMGAAQGSSVPISHVVYYVGDPDTQLVKIGTSRSLQTRLRALRETRRRALLLATEPGDAELEGDRHRQFRTLRHPLPSGEREWFRKAPILMEHIGNLRIKFGILNAGRPIYNAWVAPMRAGSEL